MALGAGATAGRLADAGVVVRSSASAPLWRALSPAEMLGPLLRHRGLIRVFAGREILERHKGAVLGVAWNVVNPLLQLAVYTAVFGYLFGTVWGRGNLPAWVDFPLVFFTGHAFFHVFAECAHRGPTVIAGRPNLVRRVVFPLEILPATVLGSAMVYLAICVGIVLVVRLAATGTMSWGVVRMVAPLVPLVMLSIGVGWFLGAVGVFVRDIRHVVGVLVQMLMFCTPLFYRLERFEHAPRWVVAAIEANPMTIIVENARRALLWDEPLEWGKLAVITAIAAVVMQLGYAVFARLRPRMADVH